MEIRTIAGSATALRPVAESASPVSPAPASASGSGQVAAQTRAAVPQAAETVRTRNDAKNGRAQADRETDTEAEIRAVQDAVDTISESIRSVSQSHGLKFAVDADLGEVVMKVIDPETEEVLKQFPSEEAIALAMSLDKMNGLLHRTRA